MESNHLRMSKALQPAAGWVVPPDGNAGALVASALAWRATGLVRSRGPPRTGQLQAAGVQMIGARPVLMILCNGG